MLEKREERIKLLKAGFNSKLIEMLYLRSNGIRVVPVSNFIELVDIDIPRDENSYMRYKVAAQCA